MSKQLSLFDDLEEPLRGISYDYCYIDECVGTNTFAEIEFAGEFISQTSIEEEISEKVVEFMAIYGDQPKMLLIDRERFMRLTEGFSRPQMACTVYMGMEIIVLRNDVNYLEVEYDYTSTAHRAGFI